MNVKNKMPRRGEIWVEIQWLHDATPIGVGQRGKLIFYLFTNPTDSVVTKKPCDIVYELRRKFDFVICFALGIGVLGVPEEPDKAPI